MPAVATPLAASVNQGMVGTPFDAVYNNQKLITVYFSVTPSGVYAALGDTLDLSGTVFGDLVKASGPPIDVELKSYNSAGDSGFTYKYRPGTTAANGLFQVMTSNGAAPNPLLDLGAGAYPAAVLADNILGKATFVRQ